MTVHAAKGLEFPIVFLVGLGRGTGGRAGAVEFVLDPVTGEPLVSVGGALPEADEATRAREVEETKRLLYVAVTRARERLYLSATVPSSRFVPGRGSLGEVLPSSLVELFPRAAAGGDVADWVAPGGGVHRFRVCRPPGPRPRRAPARRPPRRPRPATTRPTISSPWRTRSGRGARA